MPISEIVSSAMPSGAMPSGAEKPLEIGNDLSSGGSSLGGLSLVRLCYGFSAFLLLCALLALATWQGDDPSLSFANGGEVQNFMGGIGALFADLAMQFFGISAVVPLFILLFWSIFGFGNRILPRLKYRVVGGCLAMVFLSACASAIFVPQAWVLSVGLGGLFGDSMLVIFAKIIGIEIIGLNAVFVASMMLAIGLFAFIYSVGLLFGVPPKRVSNEAWQNDFQSELPQYDLDEIEQADSNGNRFEIFTAAIGFVLHIFLWLSAKLSWRENKIDEMHEIQVGDMPNFESNATNEINQTATNISNVPHAIPLSENNNIVRKKMPRKKSASLPLFEQGKKFTLPNLDLLAGIGAKIIDSSLSQSALQNKAEALERVLDDFGIKGKILHVRPGPVVTLYELEPAPGIKSSRIIGLADDIARSMSAVAVRVAVVAGRNAIGIELPNEKRETVYLRQQLNSSEFKNSQAKLPMCLGKTIGGEPIVADMARMPHLLVAGTTGSGKSVAINTMILSLLYRHSPQTCKLIMIDPKMLELSIYDGIPHLLTPVVTEPKKAVVALKWCVREMEERYRKMSKLGVRNIEGFNSRISEARSKGENLTRTVQTGFDHQTGNALFETETLNLEPMPFLVVVIDEMADLMMVAGKDIEGTVQRLAQMARAAGIHVIMATQRPSVDVITGTIKANFPTRISFQVTSKIDSRTILGEMGAEQLLGMGDMLYMAGGGRITRIHGPFVSDKEVEDVVNHLKTQGVPQYLENITEEQEESEENSPLNSVDSGEGGDLYAKAVAIVLKDRKSSISYIQRRLSVGYNKAASFIERMESEGIVSQAGHSGRREILIEEGEMA